MSIDIKMLAATGPNIDAMEKRCNAATPGPWDPTSIEEAKDIVSRWCNVAFVAHARDDVPALIARVRELEERCLRLAEEVVNKTKDLDETEEELVADQERIAEEVALKRALMESQERLAARVRELETHLEAAKSLMWMAKEWAEGGGSGGLEMRDYLEVCETMGMEP